MIKILYAEDEDDIRTIAKIALEDIGGFTVKYCQNGNETLLAIDEFQPDLLLLDVMMPGMDGPATLKKLREQPKYKNIPAIFMTAKIQPSELMQYKEMNVLDVIAKPFDPMKLAEAIRLPGTGEAMMDIKMQDKLDALYVEYAKKLPDKIKQLNEQWCHIAEQWTQEAIQEFHRAIHGLCGSSGTYGYHELSASARVLEVYLKKIVDDKNITDEEVLKITELMDEVTQTFFISSQAHSNHVVTDQVKSLKQNKLIYILQKDKKYSSELKKNLASMSYDPIVFEDIVFFSEAMKKILPGLIIVDSEYLDRNEMAIFQRLHQQDISIPLFCISSSGDLQTRLKAIRAGSDAFFLKSNELYYLTKAVDQMCASSVSEALRVLIVDDSRSLAEYYSLILQTAGMEVRYITNPLDVLDALNDFRPGLLLLDVYMPECSGLELAAVLRQESSYAGIPIVFLSTEDDRFKQLAALNLGGDDFLTKPVLPQHLVAAVRSRAKRASVLSSYITKDSLTGLLNHTNVLQHLDIELSRASRFNSTLCFMMIDIDHFKLVNDTYGHATGDHVLRKLSELLLTRLRKTDLAGRYGGEEFAVILPNTTIEAAVELCAGIRLQFSQCIFKSEDGKEFSVSYSAGIAAYPDFTDAKKLIKSADKALYQAKHEGRNREKVLRN